MITTHDYFMAHAPFPVPEWFIPEMLENCPIVTSVQSLPRGPLRDEIAGVLDDYCDWHTLEAKQWLDNREALMAAQAKWQAEFRIQVDVQWPRKWADLMMGQRP